MLSLGGVGGGDWCGGDDVGENSAEGFHDMRSRVQDFVHVKGSIMRSRRFDSYYIRRSFEDTTCNVPPLESSIR